ncbi:SPP1 family predicted phage head-tail adaptor [Paraburkholderia unamae]|uniref:phage head closure protein n=1 Tax=Paraburkholderia unamae TaxID=219649 RepID=UPI000DC27180|nr:phage head closure protein [Paraburkholderia unamae]RAR51681.1 SPP1 family predicted phage head-tail adaptor [Paraburkholderia unamae]
MRIGDFNQRATLQAPDDGREEGGQPSTQWVDVAKGVPCNVLANTGRAQIAAGADVSIVQASVRVRWRTDVTAGMRLVSGGATFSIKAVLPDFAKRNFVDLVCEVID